jgi:serine/threonine protein kinase
VVAVKIIQKAKFSMKETESLMKEVEFLREISHPHIIKFHDFFDDDPDKSLLVRVVLVLSCELKPLR